MNKDICFAKSDECPYVRFEEIKVQNLIYKLSIVTLLMHTLPDILIYGRVKTLYPNWP